MPGEFENNFDDFDKLISDSLNEAASKVQVPEDLKDKIFQGIKDKVANLPKDDKDITDSKTSKSKDLDLE